MTIVNLTPQSNGAIANQTGSIHAIPDGWTEMPEELLAAWKQCAPFVTLTVENGVITAVADNPGARAAQKAIDDAAVSTSTMPTMDERITATEAAIAMLMGV